ncbi:KRTAP12-2: Keratin-associated protein 12-2 [Crotalus adamanteus]|uniref:KRTAP12-2: Keratin-associated protein 12-2 n=1 Tax=Crotalus adamanteus TaxID=8729 RepID=A0AAW1ALN3_CROAD
MHHPFFSCIKDPGDPQFSIRFLQHRENSVLFPSHHLIHPLLWTKMASRWDLCSFNCPPTTVTIQPPPFCLSIPGPSLHCPDQPLCIEQCNPCVPLPFRGPLSLPSSGSSAASIYSQKSQQQQQQQQHHQRF